MSFVPILKKNNFCRSLTKVKFSTGQVRPALGSGCWVPTSRATYWPSTIMYQPVSPSSDPVPPSTESTAFCWTSTIIYQPVPLHTDPVPPNINQYQPILLLLGNYRLQHSLPRVLFRQCTSSNTTYMLSSKLWPRHPTMCSGAKKQGSFGHTYTIGHTWRHLLLPLLPLLCSPILLLCSPILPKFARSLALL